MQSDITWFIHTCHLCQTRKTQNVLIPPIVAMPSLLFSHIYMDTMHLPKSGRFKYIIHGQCSLCHWPEFDMLATKNHKSLGEFILHSFIYQWGPLFEIVMDNV